ncbi:multiple epidermal growth factor-like domains protein 11 [Saccostrea echinata]|uniref:multiple epidermal growth factor-like domains protein 11 n=1 Tax=Saccostrea echinata TaxID=191078 RepID=UPI002A7EC44C|nr:multiple epidermal growth factor-like domains protein 11 [Saccostrea echinata]
MPPGYMGENCSLRCRYPGFGKDCQEECFCKIDYCDYRSGCVNTILECPVGYMGLNCSMECRYPGYDRFYQEQCNCSEEFCDISTGCLESRQEDNNSNMEPTVAPILIGVIAFMTFLVLAIGGRIIWKSVKQSNSRLVQGRQEIQRLEKQLNRKNDGNEGTKENLYEDMDGQNTEEGERRFTFFRK